MGGGGGGGGGGFAVCTSSTSLLFALSPWFPMSSGGVGLGVVGDWIWVAVVPMVGQLSRGSTGGAGCLLGVFVVLPVCIRLWWSCVGMVAVMSAVDVVVVVVVTVVVVVMVVALSLSLYLACLGFGCKHPGP